MTRDEFILECVRMGSVDVGPRFSEAVDTLIERARAEGRREALIEAEANIRGAGYMGDELDMADTIADQINAIHRWDGITPFKPRWPRRPR